MNKSNKELELSHNTSNTSIRQDNLLTLTSLKQIEKGVLVEKRTCAPKKFSATNPDKNIKSVGNKFNSTINSLHYEKNVAVLKNSNFLFSRLGWLSQESEMPTKNNLKEEITSTALSDKINYYSTYKTLLQNYIIEKYKNIASIKAESELSQKTAKAPLIIAESTSEVNSDNCQMPDNTSKVAPSLKTNGTVDLAESNTPLSLVTFADENLTEQF